MQLLEKNVNNTTQELKLTGREVLLEIPKRPVTLPKPDASAVTDKKNIETESKINREK
jgi:polysaccharide deacetylase 2 family uncharacterized protein YibQ